MIACFIWDNKGPIQLSLVLFFNDPSLAYYNVSFVTSTGGCWRVGNVTIHGQFFANTSINLLKSIHLHVLRNEALKVLFSFSCIYMKNTAKVNHIVKRRIAFGVSSLSSCFSSCFFFLFHFSLFQICFILFAS